MNPRGISYDPCRPGFVIGMELVVKVALQEILEFGLSMVH